MIVAQRLISCKGGLQTPGTEAPRVLAPQLLQTNKQIRQEAHAIMCKTNNFSIVLNQASYLGFSNRRPINVSVAGGDLASIPSRWTPGIRHSVHQMRQLTLYITLNSECERVHTSSRALLKDKKLEIAAIVATALGELCEILSLSNNLTRLEVNFFDLGREELTMGNEHRILGCLGQLKELKHIEIRGLPKRAKDYLEFVVKQSKQSHRERREILSARGGRGVGDLLP